MGSNAFIGKPDKPTEDELAAALGPAKVVWDRLVGELTGECGLSADEWGSSSPKAGWSLRLKRGERRIVYLSPWRGRFVAAFALGDRAVQAARAARLPLRVKQIIDEAKRYAEGTGIRIEVSSPKDVPAVRKLVEIKLAN